RHGRRGVYYGHFGDGCLHVRIDFDLLSRQGIANFRAFMEDAADAVVRHGGSLSGEHGDGQARAELLPRMYPKEIIAGFEEFKGVWDPDDKMNPNRVVQPAKMDDDLRVFVGMPMLEGRAPELAFEHDSGSFARANRRCLGVGRCITGAGGVMCPSYRATGEEMHSTRGRARLLFEMATGDVITAGWRSPEVAEALDLCLSCKGCKRDCPVGVDMAAYKTEFLSQRYKGRIRPPSHYSMGALPRWLRLAARIPGLPRALNAAARRPALAAVAKRIAGIAPERTIPPLAPRTFVSRFRASRESGHTESRFSAHSSVLKTPTQGAESPDSRVLLWPDTFTDHFDPAIADAAVSVLGALGYRVEVPDGPVCCALTWYSTGQVDAARRVLGRTLRTLRPWLDDGVPIVVLEPSCAAALRADLPELLPSDPGARMLAPSVRTFAEVLAGHADELAARVKRTDLRALVQVHCHQHADLGAEDDRSVLKALGVDAEVLDSGCCGLAGNFGFERGHYEVSMACAERVLLPAVRAADPDVAVLADGFSCRTQLRQAGQREPVHLAQLAASALGLDA
ncbi:MAG: 4Fe-4S dicluster domain-containing protein, partial [Pseudonocardia sp.]|nr:4Fe-4S dicluster domain-containing protein [Pseudonocardia sp.]